MEELPRSNVWPDSDGFWKGLGPAGCCSWATDCGGLGREGVMVIIKDFLRNKHYSIFRCRSVSTACTRFLSD